MRNDSFVRYARDILNNVGFGTSVSLAGAVMVLKEGLPFAVWSVSFGIGFSVTRWLMTGDLGESARSFLPAVAISLAAGANAVAYWEVLVRRPKRLPSPPPTSITPP